MESLNRAKSSFSTSLISGFAHQDNLLGVSAAYRPGKSSNCVIYQRQTENMTSVPHQSSQAIAGSPERYRSPCLPYSKLSDDKTTRDQHPTLLYIFHVLSTYILKQEAKLLN